MSQSQSAKKVLLVDDNDADAYLISHLVEQTDGLKLVWRASDGDAAMMYLDGVGGFRDRGKFPVPDVVLLDLNMPHRNGYEVLEQLKTRSEKPKVVILTCCDDPVAEDRCKSPYHLCPRTKRSCRQSWSFMRRASAIALLG